MPDRHQSKVLIYGKQTKSLFYIVPSLSDYLSLTAGSWIKNVDYYRLDGSTSAVLRKKWAEEFNSSTNVR